MHYFFIGLFFIIVIYFILKYIKRIDKTIDVQDKTEELKSEHDAADAVPKGGDLTAAKVKKNRKKINEHSKL